MDKTQKQELVQYIQGQIAQTDFRLRGNVVDRQGTPYPQRSAFVIFQKFIRDYYESGNEPRWIIIPGLRGVGKTTLIAQLFLRALPYEDIYKFYISIDEVVRRFGASLWDIMEAYEEILGKRLERMDRKFFLFLDEIQYDPKWDAAVKSFYDRSKNIFVLCTGSSAVLLRKQLSADSARRAYFEELYPMNFTEYIKLKFNKYPEKEISTAIRESLFNVETADQVFDGLKAAEPLVNKYWLGIDTLEIDWFMKFGTMPFSLTITEDAVILNQLDQMLQKVVYADITQITNFDIENQNKIYSLVYMLADSSDVSIAKLSSHLETAKATLAVMLSALVNAGLLQRIAPHGTPYKQTRKPSKYLFTTPAFRFLLLSNKESITSFDNFKGKIMEDVIALYLRRVMRHYSDASLTYDSAEAGADFIIRIGKKKLVLEVGYGNKDIKQADFSLRRINGSHGMVVSGGEKLHKHENIIKVPIKFFLLI